MPAARMTSLLLCLGALLAGCSGTTPEAMLDNYSERVARVLEEPIEAGLGATADIPLFPPRRERLLALTDLRQGPIEVLALRHCDLLGLIAQRNSSLGKVMRPSGQLVYELRLLHQVRDCLSRLSQDPDADPQLKLQLAEIEQIKTRELPAVLWNAVYASSEMEANFSRGDPALPLRGKDDETADSDEAALRSLQALANIQTLTSTPDWALPADLDGLEQHYQVLNANRFGSQWLKSLWLLTGTLEHTAQALERREQRGSICPQQRPTPRARILLNVFRLYYAGEVQPYLARVHRSGERWKALHEQLLSQLPATPGMREYQWQVFATANPDSLWQRYSQARDRHTRSWQATLRNCQLMPGS
ncbi:DUF3080 family protein [Marinobacterium rhizophilum]|uniref:DUF3080 domain-containing protein n=1 Tax=Marinobacterium rhizophilum TaxID=420402 RepID=A0ABY5HLP4_9GAMM|nr:DUF3080 family protein [Marinobacterium rhizophilum]UTW13305.1 DUF3080 domain-containing protein [Marinobacterium rhizophilum]